MKLSDLTLESIREFVLGDNCITIYLSGSLILKLFNHIGFKDVYDFKNGGMPNRLIRNQYVVEKLKEINGTKELVKLIEIIFDSSYFVKTLIKDINIAVYKFRSLIIQDGYKLEKFEGKNKVIGSYFPEKFFHFSGEPSNGETSVAKPIMKKNWKKAKEICGF